nr:hypothetical protein DWF04_06320 [Cereibacter sphaeroides f. sp. denitrificans]
MTRFKKLEWEAWAHGDMQAQSAFGTYHTWSAGGGRYWRAPDAGKGTEADDPCAAAQADHDARLAAWVEPPTVQCCMCGKTGLSTAEDGGPECELHDGRWVCSSECWERACDPRPPTVAEAARVLQVIFGMANEGCDAPNAADRWCERINEVLHDPAAAAQYEQWAQELPPAALRSLAGEGRAQSS